MKKMYSNPDYEIELFSVDCDVLTDLSGTTCTDPGFEGGDTEEF